MNSQTPALPARRRLPKGVTPYVFALYMSTIMALLMCLVITLAEFGFDAHYFRNVMNAYQVAMPAAFVCVLLAAGYPRSCRASQARTASQQTPVA